MALRTRASSTSSKRCVANTNAIRVLECRLVGMDQAKIDSEVLGGSAARFHKRFSASNGLIAGCLASELTIERIQDELLALLKMHCESRTLWRPMRWYGVACPCHAGSLPSKAEGLCTRAWRFGMGLTLTCRRPWQARYKRHAPWEAFQCMAIWQLCTGRCHKSPARLCPSLTPARLSELHAMRVARPPF